MKMIRLEELQVYRVSMDIGEMVWKIVERWSYYQKDTLGKQMIRSADSIALNISEGYGRYHFGENRQFCWYSRGSAFETSTAIKKAKQRNLVSTEEYEILKAKLILYFKLINSYIKSIGNTGTVPNKRR